MSQPARGEESTAPRLNALGAYVRQRLEDMRLSKAEFGRQLGISRATVYRLLSDDGAPEHMSLERIARIAEVLDVNVDALTGLWNGNVYAVMDSRREDIVRGFVLATGDLTDVELAHTIEVAKAAAGLVRSRQ